MKEIIGVQLTAAIISTLITLIIYGGFNLLK